MATVASQKTVYFLEGEEYRRDFDTEAEALDWAAFVFDNIPSDNANPNGYYVQTATKVVFE